MRNPLIFILLLIWSLSGCSFLGFHSDPYGLEDGEEVEETAEEESFEAEEDEEEMADEEDVEEGEEEGKKRGGFFARIFSFSDSDDEAEDMMDEDEVIYGEDDEEGGMDEGDSQDIVGYEETDDMTGTDSYYAGSESQPQQQPRKSQQQQPTRKLISVKKIKSAPYRRSGFLVNAVYLARPGDSIESVSQKIYGQDRTEDLYTINSHFRSRSLKTGDKVYYSSPQRPNDSSQLLIYYEDMGQTPSYHLLEEGQNIRAVARRLLGSSHSWKEVWAINPEIQSKGAAERTVQLRYWTGMESQQVAQADETFPEEPPAPEPPPETSEPASVDASDDTDAFPPVEEDPIPDDSQNTAVGLMDSIKKNKLIAIGLIAFISLLLVSIKKIINRVRNPEEEFDYTKTSIDDNKISI